jgi:hypothetical protein
MRALIIDIAKHAERDHDDAKQKVSTSFTYVCPGLFSPLGEDAASTFLIVVSDMLSLRAQ